jgi:hypothetical protein
MYGLKKVRTPMNFRTIAGIFFLSPKLTNVDSVDKENAGFDGNLEEIVAENYPPEEKSRLLRMKKKLFQQEKKN